MIPSARSFPRTLPGPAERSRELRTGALLLVVLTAGAYLPSPLYPGYQRAFEFSDLTTTLIYATFALVSAPALVLFGQASDALGPRSVLRWSTLAAAAASACFALATGPAVLLAGRALQGLALGAATGAAGVLIGRGAPGRGSLVASTAFLAGTAIGPIAGGVLGSFDPVLLPYLVHLVLLRIAWHQVSGLPAAQAPGRWRPSRPRIPAGMRRSFAAAAVNGFLAWAVVGLFLSLIPSLLGAGPAITGGVLGSVLIFSVLVQPLVGRLGARRAQLLGLGALLLSLVLLAATAGASLLVTFPMAVAAGLGHGLVYGGASAAVVDRTPEGQRGGITGALYLAFYAGAGFPAIVVGLLTWSRPLPIATTWTALAAVALIPVGVALLLVERRASEVGVPGAQALRLRW
ncbi:MFS transporter [Saccharopolyspora griseoalba]|uniref:MFS transporter n=1 Tax=Saccharopolyspora griseoalba TaxID=1431848 RepID=A0ABW2LS93_9PSEU